MNPCRIQRTAGKCVHYMVVAGSYHIDDLRGRVPACAGACLIVYKQKRFTNITRLYFAKVRLPLSELQTDDKTGGFRTCPYAEGVT